MAWLDVLSRRRLHEILARYADLRIGVIGDLALDAYWYADMTRSLLSRETPRFPRPIVREAFSAGAGANVATNPKVLGAGQVAVLSVLGEDWRASILASVLASSGVAVDHLIASPQRSTSAYIKPILQGYDSQQEDSRLDFENSTPLSPALEDALISAVERLLPDLDSLLIADQMTTNGIITRRVRDALNGLAAQRRAIPFVVDSRHSIGLFRHMILKPNRMEALRAVASERDSHAVPRDDLTAIGLSLSAQSDRPAYVTLGEEGVLVCAEGQSRYLPAAPVRPPLDVVGAGDAFIAALAASLAAGATPWETGAIASLAAAVVVEKLNQTGTASPDEILARFDRATASDARP